MIPITALQAFTLLPHFIRKLHFDADAYWLRDIVKTAIRQYADCQRTKELYKTYRLLKAKLLYCTKYQNNFLTFLEMHVNMII